MPDVRPGAGKLRAIVLVLAIASAVLVPAWFWKSQIDRVAARFPDECSQASREGRDWSQAVPHLKDQSALLLNWALLLITGSVAVIVTSKMHGFRSIRAIYFLLAPTLTMLGVSCFAALGFEQRLASVASLGCTARAGTLNELVQIQVGSFQVGMALAALIGGICLTEVAAGYVDPGAQG